MILYEIIAVILGYLFGSIPSGLVIVKLKTGKDVRNVESGRTGGTNVMRAAGFWAGLSTAALDVLKGFLAAWVATLIVPDNNWVHILAPIAAILGHNHSIFLLKKDENGRFKLGGGAGGAPALGGAIGLWWPTVLIILPLGALVFFGVGYASIATLSVAVFAIIVFSVRLILGAPGASFADVVYGLAAAFLLLWALRPNMKKLSSGTERLVGISLNGWLHKRKNQRKEDS